MKYLRSANTDPYFNLALEQYVFDNLAPREDFFMLWQNDNAIIIGKHQNTAEEINADFVRDRRITVARRLSGGGAVYHDLGNLNFTFILNSSDDGPATGNPNLKGPMGPVAEALRGMGVAVEISGRNDMTIEGKKFSGNAQYVKAGRVMHHGTLLFDSDLDVVTQALNVSREKIESKGVKSVRSRVTNIKPYLKTPVTLGEFWAALESRIAARFGTTPYTLTAEDLAAVRKLRDEVYAAPEWNYGYVRDAPPGSRRVKKARRVEGCGSIQALLDLGEDNVILGAEFYGDYFGALDSRELAQKLTGSTLSKDSLAKALSGVDAGRYFSGLDTDTLADILVRG
jgi:lipoate-protein ligase A